jgi:TRAP-type C4-dicarboxylate transport system permease large subunit
MIFAMTRAGYPAGFSSSVVGSAAALDILIPPSIALVVFSVAVPGASVPARVASGLLPGLLADRLPAATGTLLALGHAADVPLSAWEAGFLPVQLMLQLQMLRVSAPDGTLVPLVTGEAVLFEATRPPEAAEAPNRLPLYVIVGAVLGALLLLLGVVGARRRGVAIAFHVTAAVLALAIGIFGTIIFGLWAFTDHSFTYRNENLFLANPLALAAGILLAVSASGRAMRTTRTFVLVVAGIGVIGFLIQILPAFSQVNGGIIALLLPIHVGIVGGLWAMRRRSSAQ